MVDRMGSFLQNGQKFVVLEGLEKDFIHPSLKAGGAVFGENIRCESCNENPL